LAALFPGNVRTFAESARKQVGTRSPMTH
jgi:hypothetical protein